MNADALLPPEGLRPAQLGLVLLGRVTLGHLSATIADLDARGYLRVEGADADWVLTDSRPHASSGGRGELLGYERELLAGLFAGGSEVRLSELAAPFAGSLDRVRGQLVGDAVRRGWLSRWRRGSRTRTRTRTRRGEELLAAVQEYRRGLRAGVLAGGTVPVAQVPYAMAFGLAVASPGPRPVTVETVQAPSEPEVPMPSTMLGPSLKGFYGNWQLTCNRLAEPYGGHLPGFAPPPAVSHQHDGGGYGGGHGHGGHYGSFGGYSGGHDGGGGHSGAYY